MLTGLYLHNTKVVNNSLSGGCSNRNWQEKHETQTFATALHNEGYTSFYAGKYLNQVGIILGVSVATFWGLLHVGLPVYKFLDILGFEV